MTYKKLLICLVLFTSLQACQSWIYRIDIPQGNYLDQDDIDKLRVQMSKEQVAFILGKPVVEDTFNENTWYYVYTMKRGMGGKNVRKELILEFKDGLLTSMEGDFEKPENFEVPLDQQPE
ncbi:outer membrane protein assembly factor BamE [Lacimicrobium sp. SS2-24]|uniref:outer membrane protein assembly factor BamE n=1 Tax=Lacimicrobium sp. SS2-24 TaxID=2005569 RepID=UPI000B4B3B9A|nr:outer membrane protein assembly factor BamE [Lacimicrobium sp. SS2-24]